jgi:hypothetical protein
LSGHTLSAVNQEASVSNPVADGILQQRSRYKTEPSCSTRMPGSPGSEPEEVLGTSSKSACDINSVID